jgi:dipeptidyl aminopeptidase/acylaminoacyl peptidase
MRRLAAVLAVLLLPLGPALAEDCPSSGPAPRARTPLIPRQVLFGNPDRASVRLSPDGAHLSWVAEHEGAMNVWVAPREDLGKARAITSVPGRGVRTYSWAFDDATILYGRDKDGDENFHIHAVDVTTGESRDLTPIDGVAARIAGASERFPHEILVALNDRVPMLHDLYRVDLRTGERTLLEQNGGSLGYLVDDDFVVRFDVRMNPDGGMTYRKKTPDGWEPYLEIPMEDALTSRPLGFDRTGTKAYLLDSTDRDTAALVLMDLETRAKEVIGADPRADVSDAMIHPTEKRVQAWSATYERTAWTVVDPAVKPHFDVLAKLADADFEIVSRTLDDRWWIVVHLPDDGPVRYHLYDTQAKAATFLFTNQSDLEGQPLTKMHPVVIPSRDGLSLVSYLSLPPWTDPDHDGRPDRALPMVLDVHGGPWARDEWGYNAVHQWYANRGYAVLSVNFRGSTGFGKAFINASNLEWGRKMHDDLLDAVQWAVKQGIADEARVAIAGGSYGGYATLVGLAMTPEVFACGVDTVGPSSLVTLIESVPPYWKPMLQMFTRRVGDPSTEEGRAFLLERSPLTHVDAIRRPLLIGQGANDPRVKQAEADQIVAAMEAKRIPVTYVLYPDEGHGFARPENRLAFFAIAENFLQPILGGRAEPYGDVFEGSSADVRAGREGVKGLAKVLPAKEEAAEAPAEEGRGS